MTYYNDLISKWGLQPRLELLKKNKRWLKSHSKSLTKLALEKLICHINYLGSFSSSFSMVSVVSVIDEKISSWIYWK